MEDFKPDKQILVDIVTTKMPFGKYAGRTINELPEAYLLWFRDKGFPPGKLGKLMENTFEIKANGLSPVLTELKRVLLKR